MKTVKEVSVLTGISVRTLQYYDRIGLLHPDALTEAGYRLYGDAALEKLQQILLFRELGFPLREIGRILNDPGFDKEKALEQQITLLTLQMERLERMILFARRMNMSGGNHMDFTAFDQTKLKKYAERAKAQWGHTDEYRVSQEKESARTPAEQEAVIAGFMRIFAEFGGMRSLAPDAPEVQKQVGRLQSFITEHWYHCTDEILSGLGQMYAAGGEFTENIDRAGGEGTAAFTAAAIAVYCGKAQ